MRSVASRSGVLVVVMLVVVEFMEQGLNTISKAAMSRGMSNFVFVFYSNALAIIFLLPASLFFYRKRTLPKLTIPVTCRIFVLALLGTGVQTFVYMGIGYSSPTLASVLMDLTPAFTFILALISRMEKLDMREQSSAAKVMGTIVSITGALMVTLYKGLPLTNNIPPSMSEKLLPQQQSKQGWVAGGFLIACAAFMLSLLFVVQTQIVREYPAELMVTLIACAFTTFQSGAVALLAERNVNAWILKPGIELLTIVYSALFAVMIRNVVVTWVCKIKGPLYASMFKPLGIIIATVMGVSLLGDTLYLGSVIGGVVIALGFYAVILGKSQEEKVVETEGTGSFSPKAPLLNNGHMEV